MATISNSRFDLLMQRRDILLAALRAAQAERPRRQEWVQVLDDDGRPHQELGWVAHEWSTMTAEVNRLRALDGLPPVPESTIRLVEHSAMGHIDYTNKYALRCARLAVGDDA